MEPIGHRWFPLARVNNVYSSVYSVVLHYYPSYSSYLVICIRWLQFLVFIHPWWSMMTAQCGSIFCVADLLCRELTTGGFPLQGLVMRAFLYCVALLSVPQFLFSFIRATAVHLSYTIMMTSWYGSIFRLAGPLCREPINHRWLPSAGAGNVYVSLLWCFYYLYCSSYLAMCINAIAVHRS